MNNRRLQRHFTARLDATLLSFCFTLRNSSSEQVALSHQLRTQYVYHNFVSITKTRSEKFQSEKPNKSGLFKSSTAISTVTSSALSKTINNYTFIYRLLMPGIFFFFFTTKAILLQTAQLTVYILQISIQHLSFHHDYEKCKAKIHYHVILVLQTRKPSVSFITISKLRQRRWVMLEAVSSKEPQLLQFKFRLLLQKKLRASDSFALPSPPKNILY